MADGYPPVESLFHVLLGMEVLVLLLCLWHTYRGVARKAKQASLQRENDERSGRWKQAMDRWNALYYCYRDDVVFLPGQPQKFAQPASMNTLL
jgi:outer membrane biogenesis lipoprotein LolB